MNHTLIIAGSARPAGNTEVAAERVRRTLSGPSTNIDLRSLSIHPFSYDRMDRVDDFQSVIGQIALHEQIVFATPVYWYAMSGLMKTLFDRFTDLLATLEGRTMGRSLAGRHVWLLATGTDESLPPGFHEPFARTADYFNMRWRCAFYIQVQKDLSPIDQDFGPADRLAASIGQDRRT